MRQPCSLVQFATTLAAAVVLAGCGANEDAATDPTSPQASPNMTETDTPILEFISIWKSGDRDGAVQQLLSVDWSNSNLAASTPLALSEQEFTSLPATERNSVQQEALEFATTSREVGRHAVALGEEAQAAGNDQKAKSHFDAVLEFGELMSQQDRLFAIKSVGNVLVTTASEKLSGLK